MNRSRFTYLHRDGQELIRGWIARSTEAQPENKFEAFIHAWIGLNAWASCCCEVETDRALLDLMILDPDLADGFDRLTSGGTNGDAAATFARLWPIFKVADLHDLQGYSRRSRPQHGGREAVVRFYVDHWPQADRAPNCHLEHQAGMKPDWGHTLEALYRVRNNLFHGQKSGAGHEDMEIVGAAVGVLLPVARDLLVGTGG